jgi:hypothetical protein
VRAGRFREDLYYRIAGITLQMPPLRERPGDIVPIAERCWTVVAPSWAPGARFDDDALAVLMGYPWPGNIRELRNEIARALALGDGPLLHAADFSRRVLPARPAPWPSPPGNRALPATGTLQERLDAIEAMVLREVLLRLRWNKTRRPRSWACRAWACAPSCCASGRNGSRPAPDAQRAVAAIGGCGGCSMSLLCADTADFHGLLDATPACDLLWHPSLSLASGDEVLTLLDDCRAAAAVRGRAVRRRRAAARAARQRALPPHGRQRRPMIDWVRELAAGARTWWRSAAAPPGAGCPPAGANATDACGLQYEDDRPAACSAPASARRGGLPVINIAGCPTTRLGLDTLMALAPAPSAEPTWTRSTGRASTPTSWCTTAARATSTTSSRPAPKSRPTWAA